MTLQEIDLEIGRLAVFLSALSSYIEETRKRYLTTHRSPFTTHK